MDGSTKLEHPVSRLKCFCMSLLTLVCVNIILFVPVINILNDDSGAAVELSFIQGSIWALFGFIGSLILLIPLYPLFWGILYGRHKLIFRFIGVIIAAVIIAFACWKTLGPSPMVCETMKLIPVAEKYFRENQADFQDREKYSDIRSRFYYHEGYVLLSFEFGETYSKPKLLDRNHYIFPLENSWYIQIIRFFD